MSSIDCMDSSNHLYFPGCPSQSHVLGTLGERCHWARLAATPGHLRDHAAGQAIPDRATARVRQPRRHRRRGGRGTRTDAHHTGCNRRDDRRSGNLILVTWGSPGSNPGPGLGRNRLLLVVLVIAVGMVLVLIGDSRRITCNHSPEHCRDPGTTGQLRAHRGENVGETGLPTGGHRQHRTRQRASHSCRKSLLQRILALGTVECNGGSGSCGRRIFSFTATSGQVEPASLQRTNRT